MAFVMTENRIPAKIYFLLAIIKAGAEMKLRKRFATLPAKARQREYLQGKLASVVKNIFNAKRHIGRGKPS